MGIGFMRSRNYLHHFPLNAKLFSDDDAFTSTTAGVCREGTTGMMLGCYSFVLFSHSSFFLFINWSFVDLT